MNPTKKISNSEITRVKLSQLKLTPLTLGQLRVMVLSDVHLGHRRVPTLKIIEGLELTISEERMSQIDFLIITGDFFDRRLAYDSDEAWLATMFTVKMLKRAKRHNVAIRVLKGTPSHDEGQAAWIPRINDLAEIGADVRYYDKLTIDTLYEGGPTALWIPDEVNHDASTTWRQVQDLMREKSLTTVNFAFMHGMFTYQEPIRSVVSHLEEWYFSIVSMKIVIGHHHTHTQNGIIVVPGSFERLRMNEEEDKGFYQFSFDKDRVFDEYFVINERTTIMSTFDVVGWSYADVVNKLVSLKDTPEGSHYRLLLSRKDPAFASLGQLKHQFGTFNLSHKLIEVQDDIKETGELIARPVLTSIRPDSLPGLLKPRLHDLSDEVMAVVDKILNRGRELKHGL